MSKPRQGGRREPRFPAQWLPVLAIVLGLLATIALGRLASATRAWWDANSAAVATRAADTPEVASQG